MKKGERRKEEILQYAQKVFAEKSYYEAQISDIVGLAHIAKGTVYQYFESKEDLFLALLRRYLQEWEDEVSLNIEDFQAMAPSKTLVSAYIHHRISKTIAFFEKDHERCKIILRMGPGTNDTIEKAIKIFEGKVEEIIIEDLKLGIRQGHIPEDINVELIGTAILGAVLRLGYYYFVVKKETYKNLDIITLTNYLVQLIENSMNMYRVK